jgi:UDP-glucose 4-epimerase
MKKILITGGLGYIGSILACALAKKYYIFILDKKKKNIFLKNNKNIYFIRSNLIHFKKNYRIIKRIDPEAVIHLAGQSTIDGIQKKKNSYLINNVKATETIVGIVKKLLIKKFIFSSTAAVYKQQNRALTEQSKLLPNNIYGKTKLKNELFIKNSFKNTLTKFCIFRFFNVCSSDKKNKIGEFHSPETHLIPIIIRKILENKKIYIYGKNYKTNDGTCVRDYIHVKDIVSAIIKSINYLDNNESDIFNLGSKNRLSVLQLVNFCKNTLKSKTQVLFKKKRFGDIGKLVCRFDKAKTKLAWEPKNSFIKKIIGDELWWSRFLILEKRKRKFIY